MVRKLVMLAAALVLPFALVGTLGGCGNSNSNPKVSSEKLPANMPGKKDPIGGGGGGAPSGGRGSQ